MANSIQRAAFRRRVAYGVAIFALFGLSMFWRGKLAVPFSGQVSASRWLSDRSVLALSERLELRELDQGDPEIAGATARLACIGARGVVVTALWYAAIEKQKRGEFYEFEILARSVTTLQPHFITPWVFQSWNIAYNISVENDKLGDMYFYIARGIELLAEGDRRNSKLLRSPDGDPASDRRVGSPDMRYQIGFYYQNKFSVSDKVSTLRSLMQVSCIKPTDRARTRLERNRQVDPVAFRKFCVDNPQLVRRLRAKLNLQSPAEVVQFLDDNVQIPTLFGPEGELLGPSQQFPILPEKFDEGPDEYFPGKSVDDTFDAFHAARAWFANSLTVVPPNKADAGGDPLPWRSPQAGEYDASRYRMPRSPSLVIFKQQSARAQTYLAERLANEGWFDNASAWDVDEYAGTSSRWFPLAPSGESLLLKTPTSSKQEWERAYDMWSVSADVNAMKLSDTRRLALMSTAKLTGAPSQRYPEVPEAQLNELRLTTAQVEANNALMYYEQNRSVTNFAYFLESSNAEKADITVQARKLLWEADQARVSGRNNRAIELYRTALARWRQVLGTYREFHRPGTSDTNEEATYENELKLIALLKEDGLVREKARRKGEVALALLGPIGATGGEDFLQATAEDEAVTQIVLESFRAVYPVIALSPEDPRAKALQQVTRTQAAAGAFGGAFAVPEVVQAVTIRGVVERDYPWLKEFKTEPGQRNSQGSYDSGAYWIRPELKDSIKSRLGLARKLPIEVDMSAMPMAPGPGNTSSPPGRPSNAPRPTPMPSK